jgi:hypothetical protein
MGRHLAYRIPRPAITGPPILSHSLCRIFFHWVRRTASIHSLQLFSSLPCRPSLRLWQQKQDHGGAGWAMGVLHTLMARLELGWIY